MAPFFTFISVRFDAGQIKSFEDFRMAEITASLVKELRERTGAGMMDCKKRLLKRMATLSWQSKTCVSPALSKRRKSRQRGC